MANEENVQGSLIDFIRKMEADLAERNRELKDAREMKDGSLVGYITGRRDELAQKVGEAYRDLYHQAQAEAYEKEIQQH